MGMENKTHAGQAKFTARAIAFHSVAVVGADGIVAFAGLKKSAHQFAKQNGGRDAGYVCWVNFPRGAKVGDRW